MTAVTADLAAALPDYLVERELGRGAMGIVHQGRHRSLERLVAIKELPPALAADPSTRDRFGVEARVLAALHHPHVVPVYDYVERDGWCLLIMEQLPGGTVWERFTEQGLTPTEAVAITLATCSALQHAHDRHVLHRDVKPENLMFDADGIVKVTDFGIARVLNGPGTKATMDGGVLGTPAYMAPEQAEGRTVTEQADVYATGTMLYEMLSGRLPFEGADTVVAALTQRITQHPRPLLEIAPGVPDDVAAVTMRAIEREPAARHRGAEAFGVALAAAAAEVWGPRWLASTGIEVRGSTAITDATTTPTAGARRRATMAPGGDRSTVLPDEVAAPRTSRETVVPPAAVPPVETGPVEVAAEPGPVEVPVRPQASARDVGRARDVSGELVDIAEVLTPPARPVLQYAMAAVCFAATGLAAVLGAGSTREPLPVVADGPVDLEQPFRLELPGTSGGATAAVDFSLFGVPLGSSEPAVVVDGVAEVDPGIVARLTAGALDADVEIVDVDGSTRVESYSVEASHAWFTSVAGILAVVIALFALAGIESNLRTLRRRRLRVGPLVGLAATRAQRRGAVATFATVALAVERAGTGVALPAGLAAAGAVALGLATAVNRRRRRVRRTAARQATARATAVPSAKRTT